MRQFKLDDIVKETSQYVAQSGMSFECLNFPEQGVGELFNVMEIAGILPEVVSRAKKSDVISERWRSDGNREFVSVKNDIEALKLYTKAICCAVPNGKEIAMAFANRSAVTFALQEYDDCVRDIDRALNGYYPEHLKFKLFERRGRSYMALSRHAAASEDFKEVINLVPASKLKPEKELSLLEEMSDLIQRCSVTVEPPPAVVNDLPELSQEPSSYIQCASSAVDIAFTVEMGRHVVAAVDVHPGDVIAIEKPYASVVLPPDYHSFCEYCKKRTHSSIPCTTCTEVVYCSESCRDFSWRSHHSTECSLLPSLASIGCDKMECLALRVLLLATECGRELHKFIDGFFEPESCSAPEKRGFLDGKYLSDDYTSTHNLETNRHLRSNDDIIRRGTVAVCIIHLLRQVTDFFDYNLWQENEKFSRFEPVSDLSLNHIVAADLVLRYLMSVPCNAHEIAEMRIWPSGDGMITESTEIGGAIYPFHSLLNHSCDPNVVRHAFGGDVVVLSAIQFVPKGEQIFDNYGYHHAVHNLTTRRERLAAQYYFTCDCVACRDDWPMYRDLPESCPQFLTPQSKELLSKSSQTLNEILPKIKNGQVSKEYFDFLTRHLALLHLNVKRPWKEYNLCQEAIKQCLSLKANHYVHKHDRRS